MPRSVRSPFYHVEDNQQRPLRRAITRLPLVFRNYNEAQNYIYQQLTRPDDWTPIGNNIFRVRNHFTGTPQQIRRWLRTLRPVEQYELSDITNTRAF